MPDIAKIPGTVDGSCFANFPITQLPRTSVADCLPIRDVVGNDAVSGEVECPDGLCSDGVVTYSMAANKYFADSKEEANTLATEAAKWFARKAGCFVCSE